MCGNAQLTFHRNDIVNIHHKVDEWHIPVLQQRFDEIFTGRNVLSPLDIGPVMQDVIPFQNRILMYGQIGISFQQPRQPGVSFPFPRRRQTAVRDALHTAKNCFHFRWQRLPVPI